MKINSIEPKNYLVAVYGTLRHGFGNHRLLKNKFSEFLGTERAMFPFRMVSLGGFPGLIPTKEEHQITIEVYRITSDEVEQNLDDLEGYPHFYDKAKINTTWGEADVYILHENKYGNRPDVESGDWVKFTTSHLHGRQY